MGRTSVKPNLVTRDVSFGVDLLFGLVLRGAGCSVHHIQTPEFSEEEERLSFPVVA